MGKTKVTEEQIAEWVRLRQKGQSYRTIATADDVDPRTVKAWVQRAGEEKEKEHWEAVSREVDAKYLDEHYRLLVQAAVSLLDAVRVDPAFVHHELDAQSPLNSAIQFGMKRAAELVKGRGMNLDPTQLSDRRTARIGESDVNRLSRKLHGALMEHEPRMKIAVDGWRSYWAGFQQARLQLAEAAKDLFKHRNVPDEVAEALKLAVVMEALESKLFGKQPCSSRVEQGDRGQAVLIRHSQEAEQRLCKGSEQEIEAACSAYDVVLQQVSHEERMRPVENAYHRLVDCVREVEDLVDRLVLVGKPQGRCPLCLNHSIRRSYF